jgi:hypothetical protein
MRCGRSADTWVGQAWHDRIAERPAAQAGVQIPPRDWKDKPEWVAQSKRPEA